MGVLSDYFTASKEELATVSSSAVPERLARIDAKGFGVVPMESLAKLIGAGKKAFESGPPVRSGDDYEWLVMTLTSAMVDALASLSDADVKKHGAAIAKIEELEWPAAEAQKVLKSLRSLAEKARSSKKTMYLWMST